MTCSLKDETRPEPIKVLLERVAKCRLCEAAMGHAARPVLSMSADSRVAIIGQAPGRKVHASGIPWDDASGRLLREWLDVSDSTFYDTRYFALMPMGFCYPGKSKEGDLPPRSECAPLWHPTLLQRLKSCRMILLIGLYAQKYYLGKDAYPNLTENVRHYHDYLPRFFPLPHPSPRNRIWMARNPWFQKGVLPALKSQVAQVIS